VADLARGHVARLDRRAHHDRQHPVRSPVVVFIEGDEYGPLRSDGGQHRRHVRGEPVVRNRERAAVRVVAVVRDDERERRKSPGRDIGREIRERALVLMIQVAEVRPRGVLSRVPRALATLARGRTCRREVLGVRAPGPSGGFAGVPEVLDAERRARSRALVVANAKGASRPECEVVGLRWVRDRVVVGERCPERDQARDIRGGARIFVVRVLENDHHDVLETWHGAGRRHGGREQARSKYDEPPGIR